MPNIIGTIDFKKNELKINDLAVEKIDICKLEFLTWLGLQNFGDKNSNFNKQIIMNAVMINSSKITNQQYNDLPIFLEQDLTDFINDKLFNSSVETKKISGDGIIEPLYVSLSTPLKIDVMKDVDKGKVITVDQIYFHFQKVKDIQSINSSVTLQDKIKAFLQLAKTNVDGYSELLSSDIGLFSLEDGMYLTSLFFEIFYQQREKYQIKSVN